MMLAIQRVIDRILMRSPRTGRFSERSPWEQRVPDDMVDRLSEALTVSESPSACRVCGKRGSVQVSARRPSDGEVRAEYLCYDDLGAFMELFADPAITEFAVVRL